MLADAAICPSWENVNLRFALMSLLDTILTEVCTHDVMSPDMYEVSH